MTSPNSSDLRGNLGTDLTRSPRRALQVPLGLHHSLMHQLLMMGRAGQKLSNYKNLETTFLPVTMKAVFPCHHCPPISKRCGGTPLLQCEGTALPQQNRGRVALAEKQLMLTQALCAGGERPRKPGWQGAVPLWQGLAILCLALVTSLLGMLTSTSLVERGGILQLLNGWSSECLI